MARRSPIGCLGWVVVCIIGAGALGNLAHRDATFSPLPAREVSKSATAASPFATSEPSEAATPLLRSPKKPGFAARTLYVTASTLNVRSKPEKGASVLLSVSKGTAVVAVSQVEGWFEVRLTDGSTGWMSSAFLAEAPPKQALQASSTASSSEPPKKSFNRAAVVSAIIKLSIQSYYGSCPCPYNVDRGGRSCGRRSAYSRPGGDSPICYPRDVTQAMIEEYLAER